MKKFGIIIKAGSVEAAKLGSKVAAWLIESKGCEVYAENTTGGAVKTAKELVP